MWKYKKIVKVIGKVNEVFQSIIASFHSKVELWLQHISVFKMDLFGDINLTGLLSIIIFYLLILGVGMWAARKKSNVEGVSEEVKIDVPHLYQPRHDILIFYHQFYFISI